MSREAQAPSNLDFTIVNEGDDNIIKVNYPNFEEECTETRLSQ